MRLRSICAIRVSGDGGGELDNDVAQCHEVGCRTGPGFPPVSLIRHLSDMPRRPNNTLFLILFTICLGGYMAISVAGVGKHILANLVFQFTLGWVLLLLYSLPSFCGDMSLFDIKHYSGFLGYQICLVAACGLGAMAAMKIAHAKAGQIDVHAMGPVAGGALWMFGALWSLRVALGYFYEEFLMAIVIYAWVYPLDQAFRFYQALWNAPWFIEFWKYLGEWSPC